MRKVINYLFNKGYLPFNRSKFMTDKAKKKIYDDPKHAEFKEALLHDICKEMAESYAVLSQPVKNLEMKGELNAITRVYGRIIEIFAPKQEMSKNRYIDPIKKIEKSIMEKHKNKL